MREQLAFTPDQWTEARGWLTDIGMAKRTVGRMTNTQVQTAIDTLYDGGIKQFASDTASLA